MPDQDWNSGRAGEAPGADPWQEMPSYYEGPAGGPGSSWQDPPPHAAPSGPVVPVERLGSWLEGAWNVLAVDFRGFVVVQLLVIGLSVVSLGTLTGPLIAGYYRYALRRSRGEAADFNDVFSGLSGSFKATFPVGLALAGSFLGSVCVLAALDLVVSQFPLPSVALLLRAALDLTGLVVMATGLGVFGLMLPLIHEKGHTPAAAFETCMSLLRTSWARTMLFAVVVGGAPLLGFLILGVGVLAGGPLGVLVGAYGFRGVFMAEEGPAAAGSRQ